MKLRTPIVTAISLSLLASVWAAPVVVCPPGAAPQEQLATKEVARYVYLRTGELPAHSVAPVATPDQSAP